MKTLTSYRFTMICLLSTVILGCGGGGGGNNNGESDPPPSPNQAPVDGGPNQAPVITNLTASPNPVAKGQTMTVTATVSDPNGDTLNYQWTVPAGYTIQSGQGGSQIVVLATQLLAKGNVQVTVSDGSLTATSSVAVSTNDRTWGTAGPIENDNGDGSIPEIAMAANGDAIAVWAQYDSTRNSVWANRYVASTGWETAGPIENNNKKSYDPIIAMDANGNAIAVWVQEDGTRQNVWAKQYTTGVGWRTAAPIETDDKNNNRPEIAMNANGDAIAVWTRCNDGPQCKQSNIWANRYVAGVGWGTAGPIEADDKDNYSPAIAMDASGNAIVVWTRCTDAQCTQASIQANRYTAGTGWGTAAPIETGDKNNWSLAIAMDTSGNAIAVWTQCTDAQCTQASIQANRYTAGTGWGTAAPIETNGKSNYGPDIAMAAGGDAVAVWEQFEYVDSTRTLGTYNIWANEFK